VVQIGSPAGRGTTIKPIAEKYGRNVCPRKGRTLRCIRNHKTGVKEAKLRHTKRRMGVTNRVVQTEKALSFR